MENTPVNFNEEENNTAELKKDRSVTYMGIILGLIILIMAYMTLFIDDPWGMFHEEEKLSVVNNRSESLNEVTSMTDEEVRKSLITFIEAFYYDQKKGYFDPPSYFAPITKTFYNFHNLTYDRLKDLYWKRMADMKNLDRNWIVSTLDFARTDTGIVATYWAREKYFSPAINQQQSIDRKYEMIIDDNGKIYSLREEEFKNFETYAVTMDTAAYSALANPVPGEPANKPTNTDQKTYDASVVEVVPEFRGGMAELTKFLKTNLRYPAGARENKTQGKVYLAFVVEKDGTLRNITVRQGLGNGCDEEAVRLLRTSPPWNPGMINGTAVTTYYVLPVPFELN